MDAISMIDYEFREVANVVGLLNMVTLGYYGSVDQQANEKILQAINLLKLRIEGANQHIQQLIRQEHRIARMKDEFTSNVNHELRTPLTSILGTTDYLLDVIDDIPIEESKK
ncbi:MAG: hypothetical protein OEZ36_08645, partial [Spirochaetota bacterium]|nr:hypothetical protein [Spirochaetota bacterium]